MARRRKRNNNGGSKKAGGGRTNGGGGQRRPGNAPAGSANEPPLSAARARKDVEDAQERLRQENASKVQASIEAHAREQRAAGRGLEVSTSLVVSANKVETREVPDLDPSWVTPINFVPYLPGDSAGSGLPGTGGDGTVGQLHRADVLHTLNGDCAALLRLPFREFWCHVVYDKTLGAFIDSFLRYAPRHFDADGSDEGTESDSDHSRSEDNGDDDGDDGSDTAGNGVERQLRRRVLAILVRMATNREGDGEFMDRTFHGELLYNNWVFDVPKLLDVCALFGWGAPEAVRAVVGGVVKAQPLYLDNDWRVSIPYVTRVLDQLAAAEDQAVGDVDGGSAAANAVDMLRYVGDIAATLQAFFAALPAATRAFVDDGALDAFVTFFDTTLPRMAKHPQVEAVPGLVATARGRVVDMVDAVLDGAYFDVLVRGLVVTDRPPEVVAAAFTDWINAVFLAHADRTESAPPGAASPDIVFLRDYDEAYHLRRLLHRFSASNSFDSTRVDYLVECLNGVCGNTVDFTGDDAANDMGHDDALAVAGAAVDAETLTTAMSAVKELFADFGDGFVMAVLDAFDYDSAEAIHHLLENNLPPPLDTMDRSIAHWAPPSAGLPSRHSKTDIATDRKGKGRQADSDDGSGSGSGVWDAGDDVYVRRNIYDDADLAHGVMYAGKSSIGADKTTDEEMAEIRRRIHSYVDVYDDEVDDAYDSPHALRVSAADGEAYDDSKIRGDGSTNDDDDGLFDPPTSPRVLEVAAEAAAGGPGGSIVGRSFGAMAAAQRHSRNQASSTDRDGGSAADGNRAGGAGGGGRNAGNNNRRNNRGGGGAGGRNKNNRNNDGGGGGGRRKGKNRKRSGGGNNGGFNNGGSNNGGGNNGGSNNGGGNGGGNNGGGNGGDGGGNNGGGGNNRSARNNARRDRNRRKNRRKAADKKRGGAVG